MNTVYRLLDWIVNNIFFFLVNSRGGALGSTVLGEKIYRYGVRPITGYLVAQGYLCDRCQTPLTKYGCYWCGEDGPGDQVEEDWADNTLIDVPVKQDAFDRAAAAIKYVTKEEMWGTEVHEDALRAAAATKMPSMLWLPSVRIINDSNPQCDVVALLNPVDYDYQLKLGTFSVCPDLLRECGTQDEGQTWIDDEYTAFRNRVPTTPYVYKDAYGRITACITIKGMVYSDEHYIDDVLAYNGYYEDPFAQRHYEADDDGFTEVRTVVKQYPGYDFSKFPSSRQSVH